ncbi:MAG: glycoside hydrolase family protein [Methylovulum sp.]|uniref:glycoside hydrolase family protein n=1 Tax=Methylovulum sp. TaxID=1916980 RepID=UPI002601C6B6|nr:glycoside hydrolase family protein [Methylovulum sp.]MDD2725639.1 glycoside hydrolase family protein [Methylovulum sp.]MDD5125947.1 glycoside hydrolase family protein [Methylovulum sp.]
MSRQINEDGLNLVKEFEGLRLDAYRCPAGVWTIGYGHTLGVKPGAKISEDKAEHTLAQDLAESGAQVEKCVKVKLNDNQHAALASFVFNAGIGSLTVSTLLKRLNAGDYQCVPSELAKWVKASDPKTGQKIALPGLVKRRAAEAVLWLKTDSDDPFLTSTDMPQSIHADDPRISYLVAARDGLRMRSGAGANFDIAKVLPRDTEVFVLKEKDGWAAVDLQGDGAIDGWVAQDFLKPKTV